MSIKPSDLQFFDGAPHLPLSERVLDRLCDILYATDEIKDMLRVDGLPSDDDRMVEVGETVCRVYDEVNELMKRMAD